MAGPPRPDNSNPGSPLDKLSKDVAQYQKAHSAGKVVRRPAPAPAAPQPAVVQVKAPVPAEPGWVELDRGLSSQMTASLLIAGYAILMLGAGIAVTVFAREAAAMLWPVLAMGVIVSMIASHKGRPPLLWFMYGSVVPLLPVLASVVMGLVTKAVSGATAGLGLGQGGLGGSQSGAGAGMTDLFLCVCVVGAIPLVHALLAEPDRIACETRQLASGMRKCPPCGEIIRREARVCRYCHSEQA